MAGMIYNKVDLWIPKKYFFEKMNLRKRGFQAVLTTHIMKQMIAKQIRTIIPCGAKDSKTKTKETRSEIFRNPLRRAVQLEKQWLGEHG
jgi:hypothetical protein